jgi:hypothetical protein
MILFNNNSDKDFLSHPWNFFYHIKLLKPSLINEKFSTNRSNENSAFIFSNKNNLLSNQIFTFKNQILSSLNQNILPVDQVLRQYWNLNPIKTNFNLEGLTSWVYKPLNLNLDNLYYNTKSYIINDDTYYKLTSNRINLIAPYPGILDSSNPFSTLLNYDSANSIFNSINLNLKFYEININQNNDLTILKGKRDGAPEFLNTSYWSNFWANTSPNLRFKSILESLKLNELNYLPYFNNYYDYDFRTFQAYELLEDLIWENNYSTYSHTSI